MAKGERDPKITVSAKERVQWKAQRLKLKLTTRGLAAKANLSNGTISNIENGTTTQVKASVYYALNRALFGAAGIEDSKEQARDHEAAVKELMEAIVESGADPDRIRAFARIVKP